MEVGGSLGKGFRVDCWSGARRDLRNADSLGAGENKNILRAEGRSDIEVALRITASAFCHVNSLFAEENV